MRRTVSFSDLRPSNYLVLRWFGKNHLLRVTDVPSRGHLGWSVRAKEVTPGRPGWDDWAAARAERLLILEKSGRRVYRLPYYTRLMPVLWLLCGRPRWGSFVNREAAITRMDEMPNFGCLDLLVLVLAKCFSPRVGGYVFVALVALGTAFFPVHLAYPDDEQY